MEYNISHNAKALLEHIPMSGAAIGNVTLRKQLGYDTLEHTGTEYQDARQELLDAKLITLGRGKGGSVKRVVAPIEDEIPF